MTTVQTPESAPREEHEHPAQDVYAAPSPSQQAAGGFWDTAVAVVLLLILIVAGTGVALWLQ
jgi:uncharacterized protein HemX